MHLEAFTFLLCSSRFPVQQDTLKIRNKLQTYAEREDLRDAEAPFKEKLQYEMINSSTLSIKHIQRCLFELLCAFLKYGNIMKTGKTAKINPLPQYSRALERMPLEAVRAVTNTGWLARFPMYAPFPCCLHLAT